MDQKIDYKQAYYELLHDVTNAAKKELFLPYPQNLIAAVFPAGTEPSEPSDLRGTVEYVLCSLPEREREILELRFRQRMTLADIAKQYSLTRERVRQIIAHALRLLRRPERSALLSLGIAASREAEKVALEKQTYERAFADGYIAAVGATPDGKPATAPDPRIMSIEMLGLSARSRNGLRRANIRTADDILCLDSFYDLLSLRCLGQKSVHEIVDRLISLGYPAEHLLAG